jgi:hypothetical protein
MRKRLASVVLLALLALVSLAGSVAAVSEAAGAPTIDIRLDHFFMDLLMGGGCGGG